MTGSYMLAKDPSVPNFPEECVSASLMWQCSGCGYSESVQGSEQNGVIHIGENNDFYIVNWRIFNNENFVREVPVIYHVKRSVLNDAIRQTSGSRYIPQQMLGCCGRIRLIDMGGRVCPENIRFKVDETRIHNMRKIFS